jgi:hypothetical protein
MGPLAAMMGRSRSRRRSRPRSWRPAPPTARRDHREHGRRGLLDVVGRRRQRLLPRLVRGLEALLEASLLGIWASLATDAITQRAPDPKSSASEKIDEALSWHRACSSARQSSSLLPCSGLDRTNCFDDGSCCPRVNGRVCPPEKTRRFVRKG